MAQIDSAAEVLEIAKQERVRFLRLQFTDILGSIKNVEIPEPQFERALDGQVVFDGSAIGGFFRLEESDMILWPDPATFRVFPWEDRRGKVARMICDVRSLDGSPFPGCPRTALKNVVKQAEDAGYRLMVGIGSGVLFVSCGAPKAELPALPMMSVAILTLRRSIEGKKRAEIWFPHSSAWSSTSRAPIMKLRRASMK